MGVLLLPVPAGQACEQAEFQSLGGENFPDHCVEIAKQLYSKMAKLADEIIASDDCAASGYLKSQETTEP